MEVKKLSVGQVGYYVAFGICSGIRKCRILEITPEFVTVGYYSDDPCDKDNFDHIYIENGEVDFFTSKQDALNFQAQMLDEMDNWY